MTNNCSCEKCGAASSESNIENEEGYQDAGEIGPDNSVFYAWWAWAAAVVFVVVLSLSCVRALT